MFACVVSSRERLVGRGSSAFAKAGVGSGECVQVVAVMLGSSSPRKDSRRCHWLQWRNIRRNVTMRAHRSVGYGR